MTTIIKQLADQKIYSYGSDELLKFERQMATYFDVNSNAGEETKTYQKRTASARSKAISLKKKHTVSLSIITIKRLISIKLSSIKSIWHIPWPIMVPLIQNQK